MCINCAVRLGKHTITDEIDECPVCLEDKIMLIIKYNHKI